MASKKERSAGLPKVMAIEYYTLAASPWDSYEAKFLRNNAVFEIGFIMGKNKKPDRFMVYPVTRNINDKEQIRYYLAQHTVKNMESISGYSRYNMECRPLYELELLKKTKGSPYAAYKAKQDTRKTLPRKIKQDIYPITKILI